MAVLKMLLELAIVLAAIFLGAWLGGVGIGFAGGMGVLTLALTTTKPGSIPFDVISIIMAVISAIATMQICGGLDWLVLQTARILRKNPKYITILAPLVTFFLTLVAGTGNISLAALPVIVEVAKEQNIKPCRPLSTAVVAAQIAITASPISAAVVYTSGELEKLGIGYMKLLGVLLPSTFVGVMVMAVGVSYFFDSDLSKDPNYLARIEEGLVVPPKSIRNLKSIDSLTVKNASAQRNDKISGETPAKHDSLGVISSLENVPSTRPSDLSHHGDGITGGHAGSARKIGSFTTHEEGLEEPEIKPYARLSVLVFMLGVLCIVVYAVINSSSLGLVKKPLMNTTNAILVVMLTVATILTIVAKIASNDILNSSTFQAGMSACICILGVAWLGDTFVQQNLDWIKDTSGNLLQTQGWLLALIFFVCSALLYSQAATAKALYPMAIGLGVSNLTLVASFPATAGLFILPTYPTLVASVQMDDTGTTQMGSYVFNHPFFVPGTIGVFLSVGLAFALGSLII